MTSTGVRLKRVLTEQYARVVHELLVCQERSEEVTGPLTGDGN